MNVAEELFGSHLESISLYVDILAGKGIEWGLIGPREGDRIWDRHIFNSVAISDLLSQGATVVDVGSGAGLPGLPLAILRPDLRVTLLEPLLRRATFLAETVSELGLDDSVAVVRARAEDHRQRYDAVVSRALAPLDRLLTWCGPLRRRDGIIVALKGRTAADELAAVTPELNRQGLVGAVLAVRAHPATEVTSAVRLRSR
ncbi:16S rRNA (guanine(527)-N(7))-methyltransferase RsmG [uncultured Friedmanniella sp.]|uniref:16S rRNA (guanine(527)-N(7))-methyltransferase RsmG n=1 Tax=uncultured Friedmanniella sp. TaxID=335381 RepID=UPI0035CC04FA